MPGEWPHGSAYRFFLGYNAGRFGRGAGPVRAVFDNAIIVVTGRGVTNENGSIGVVGLTFEPSPGCCWVFFLGIVKNHGENGRKIICG